MGNRKMNLDEGVIMGEEPMGGGSMSISGRGEHPPINPPVDLPDQIPPVVNFLKSFDKDYHDYHKGTLS